MHTCINPYMLQSQYLMVKIWHREREQDIFLDIWSENVAVLSIMLPNVNQNKAFPEEATQVQIFSCPPLHFSSCSFSFLPQPIHSKYKAAADICFYTVLHSSRIVIIPTSLLHLLTSFRSAFSCGSCFFLVSS